MGKRLLLFGPPGVGKGTHAKRLAGDLGIPHVATGDLFREAIQRGTELGRTAAEFIRRGELVPDQIAVAILEDRLARPDAGAGYLLDGFPRTLPQARALDARLEKAGEAIDCVLALEAPEDVLVGRLAGRLTCSGCQTTFNRVLRPPARDGVCDRCGAALFQRPDDGETTVRRRLLEYRAKTDPVLAFFRAENWRVQTITSVGSVDDIYGRILGAAGA